ncbi:MAG: efflux RND transporter periplasmic adaptor subunit [Defluviitaleaceae bacterium]|nr:efflux RND transporter periplasmic adaptor subunit [Defluviitaleaceae bacterium]
MKNSMKKILLFALLVTAAFVFVACGSGDVEQTGLVREAVLVETISPETGDIIVMGEYIGTVEANQTVAVLPRLPGEVLSVYFAMGDAVEAGDVLFSIDTAEIENNITALEAQLAVQDAIVAAARTGVALVDGSAMQSQILQVAGGINQAEAAIRQAEQNVEQALIGIEQAQMGYDLASQAYNDTAVLFEAGVVARIAYDQAEAGYVNAAAGLERAQSGYTLANIGLATARQAHEQALEGHRILVEDAPDENRQRALDGLAQAQAARNTLLVNIDLARERLDDATVRSPISGIIEMRNVEPFGFANPAAPAFLISDRDSLNVAFRVPRNNFEHLSVGDEITIYDGLTPHIAVLTEVASSIDAMSGLVSVRATIPNPPEGLLSGTAVRIFAEAQRAENVQIVPLGVVHFDRGIPHVYVDENGVARRVRVEVGIFDAQNIHLISDADRIISTWSARLADGIEVREVVREAGRGA